jgi:kumamolisin
MAQAAKHSFGLIQPLLYAGVAAGQAAPGFHDIISGSNGAYSAGPGWDACAGLGSPNGTALLARLTAATGTGPGTTGTGTGQTGTGSPAGGSPTGGSPTGGSPTGNGSEA